MPSALSVMDELHLGSPTIPLPVRLPSASTGPGTPVGASLLEVTAPPLPTAMVMANRVIVAILERAVRRSAPSALAFEVRGFPSIGRYRHR